MAVWVDADACPGPIRDILLRAAARSGVELVFVANRALPLPQRENVRAVQVAGGFDVADHYIAARAGAGDLVITADIPLAAECMANGAQALSPRGEAYTADTIRQRLNLRDFMDTLRSSGIQSGGPPPLGARDKQAFANALDRWLARHR